MRRCLAAVALVLLVASCSSDGEDVVASTTTTSRASTTTSTTSGSTPVTCTAPSEPAAGEGEMLVTVFYTCDDGTLETLVPVVRAVPTTTGVLRASLDSLVAGPGDTGLVSWFSDETASVVRSVDVDGDHAVVDFADLRNLIPNASTSAGSKMLLDQLDATVFQHPTIRTAEYRMEGSCDAFSEWLQLSCADRTRD